MRIGRIVRTKSTLAAGLRDIAIRTLAATPLLGAWLHQHMPRVEWRVGTGGPVSQRRSWRSPAGRLLKQPSVVGSSGVRRPLDALLGHG